MVFSYRKTKYYVKVLSQIHTLMTRFVCKTDTPLEKYTGKNSCISKYKYIPCVLGVDRCEGVLQHRRGLPSHRLAARSPRGGFSHPHQEHMIDTLSCIFYFI